MSVIREAYTRIAKTLHWIVALLVLGLLPIGFLMTSLDYSPFKIQLYGWHKSFGTIVLGVMVLRVLYRAFKRYPLSLKSHKFWEKKLAHLVHALLYVCLLAMPVSGWLMSSAGGFPYSFFGLVEMPTVMAKDETVFKVMRDVHAGVAWAIVVFVSLHVVGALKHHVIDNDQTLIRMTGSRVIYSTVLFFYLLSVGVTAYVFVNSFNSSRTVREDVRALAVSSSDDISVASLAWQILPDESVIQFEATQYGQVFEGAFTGFLGDIYFDVEDLENSSVKIQVPTQNLRTGSKDRDSQALSADWFAQQDFPYAYFESNNFKNIDANRYVAKGYLTIRGIKLPLNLHFTLTFSEDGQGQRAVVDAYVDLSRLDFGVGQGQWKDTQVIGNKIKTSIHVEAFRE